jgi:cytochrome P450
MATDVGFNPLDADFRADPHPIYHLLRQHDPVHWSEARRAWVLTRHADVVQLLRDDRFSADRSLGERYELPARGRPVYPSMLMLDPPDHTRLRNLVSKAFTPRMVERLRPRIEAITTELLDRAARGRGMDVVADFAYPLPVIVIAEMLGVPPEDRQRFQDWSAVLIRTLDAGVPADLMESAYVARDALRAYLGGIVALRRQEPRDDMISELIAVEERGDALSEPELLTMCQLLLVAGHETTVNLIGNGVLTLLENRDERERLHREPELARSAVEEMMRFTSPVQVTGRVALEDMEIGGRAVRARQTVTGVLAAANRDPEVFSDPDRLDLGRDPNPQIGFGRGIHFCLGAPLARLEAQIAIPALFERFRGLVLAGAPEPRPMFVLRGLQRLPVAFA